MLKENLFWILFLWCKFVYKANLLAHGRVWSPSTSNIKSHTFGSTKHKADVETAKYRYSVFKGEISNQSFNDVPSISALISLQAKVQSVSTCRRMTTFSIVFWAITANTKSHIFGSTKHKAVVKNAKYSVFKELFRKRGVRGVGCGVWGVGCGVRTAGCGSFKKPKNENKKN